MKVLFDQQIFSNQSYGGISRYFCELARELHAKKDISARVLSPLCTNYHAKTLPMNVRVGIPFPHANLASRYLRYFNRRGSSQLIKWIKPDILHETYYPLQERKLLPGMKLVTTVYDMIHELFPDGFPSLDRTSEFKLRAVNRVDHIICISENTRKDLIKLWGIDPAKTSTVHLGVDHHQYVPLPRMRRSPIPYFLYVGLRGSYKNFINAIQAYGNDSALKREFDFVCFGGGKPTNDELKLLNQLNIPESKFSWQSGGDSLLCSLYQHAAAFVYPSLYEGFGIPPFEAMIQRCPVVCSNTASLPEVLGKAAEFFNPYDVEDIRQAMSRVVSSPAHSMELRSRGIQQANAFTWKSCGESTLRIYETLVKEID